MERIELAGIGLDVLMRGEGPPLLFLHGGDYVAQNRPFLDRLAHRWHVIAPRHPGFGNTPRPPWFRSVHDIAYLYLDLIERLELDNVLLVGSSLGGWIALELAVRSQARLGGLVLIDSLGLKFGGCEEQDIADIYALPAEEVVRRSFADPARFVPDYTTSDEAEVMAVARDREATALYGWKPYMHDPALRHWLHRITRATLILWGEQDGIVPVEYGRKVADALPHARFHTIPNAGHYPQIEQPEAVDHLIAEITLPEMQR
jgi:pimeloyl-ACP methyl ester carboxylesterase